MTKLYEIKKQVFSFCAEYETYLKYAYRFVIALALFGLINGSIGFMGMISSFPATILMALVCCIMPQGFTLFVGALLVVLNLYVLSTEVALTTLIIFAVLFLLYFRFSPRDGMLVAITPICYALGVPYVLPIGAGLLRKSYSLAAIACGTIAYYFVDGVYENVTALQATSVGGAGETAKMTITASQLLSNKEMYLMVVILSAATIVVNVVRKMKIDHAWKIAMASGALVQVAGLFAGYIVFDLTDKAIGMIIGNIVAVGLGLAIEFLFMDLDYTRTERVQFEDDDFVYYVKAVPKKAVAAGEKTVTQFSGFDGLQKRKKKDTEKVTRKEIADELEIDEELLK